MTQRRDLKQLIRERMAKTGERYTAARAHILHEHPSSTSPSPLPAGLFAGYPLAPGVCMDTGAMRNVLEHSGLTGAHDGTPLSEAMVAGLCGGICFLYLMFEYKGMPPMLSVLARFDTMADSFVAGGIARLGLAGVDSSTSSAASARKALDAAIAAGTPALCVVDAVGMIPGQGPLCMAGMAPTVVAVCGHEGDDLLVDTGAGVPRRMSHADFARVRSLYKKGKHRLMTVRRNSGPFDLAPAVLDSIRATARRFVEAPYKGFAGNFGIAGMEKLRRLLTDPGDRKGWSTVFGEGPSAYLGLRRLHDGIMHEYTSPGAGRPMYAAFLREAAAVIGRREPLAAADCYARSGLEWLALADCIARCGDPAVEEGCRQGESAMELFAESGRPCAPPGTGASPASRGALMQSCRLTRARAGEIYAELAGIMDRILAAEREGLTLLQQV